MTKQPKARKICGVKITPKWDWTPEYAREVRKWMHAQMRDYPPYVRKKLTMLPEGQRP